MITKALLTTALAAFALTPLTGAVPHQDAGSAPDSKAESEAAAILAVDTEGQPVAGVTFRLIDTLTGTFGAAPEPRTVTTGPGGRVTLPAKGPLPLSLECASEEWGISFVHAKRVVDESVGRDLLGNVIRSFAGGSTIACVLERTGKLEVRIPGASNDDVHHVVFVDERPELDSHRSVRASRTFRGKRVTVSVPAGRGTLYVARKGWLGSPVMGAGVPHLVSVSPGRTSSIDIRLIEGPITTLQAPFDNIPFDAVEGLAPDTETIIGTFPFDSSPLRIPSLFAIALGSGFQEGMELGTRLPKHLLRAAGVPLLRPSTGEERPAYDPAAPPGSNPADAPLDLVFAIDIGGKLRLPEVDGGWLRLAHQGTAVAKGILGAPRPWRIERPRLGEVVLPALEARDVLPSWNALLRCSMPDGTPAAHREVLIAASNGMLVRSLTNADGQLKISGLSSASASVALLQDLGQRVTMKAPEHEGSEGEEAGPKVGAVEAQLNAASVRRIVAGTWRAKDAGAAATGGLLALVPTSEGESDARRVFQTRAVALTLVDSDGRFSFGDVPIGGYELRAVAREQSWSTPLAVPTSTDELTITLEGFGESMRALPAEASSPIR